MPHRVSVQQILVYLNLSVVLIQNTRINQTKGFQNFYIVMLELKQLLKITFQFTVNDVSSV